MIESLLLAVTRITTMSGQKALTGATGFFFEQDGRLFLVTNRHVVLDETGAHHPDRLEIELHTDSENVGVTRLFSIPLYRNRKSVWRDGRDSKGPVDVAVLELERARLPPTLFFKAFTPAHLIAQLDQVEVGTPVLIVGFPLGFHDTLHRLPVARQAVIASAFGIRFQGNGYFLTDARMHRGTSGAPVVVRAHAPRTGRTDFPWRLLGIHATRMDIAGRDAQQDEHLDLNCAWYADMLLTLTR